MAVSKRGQNTPKRPSVKKSKPTSAPTGNVRIDVDKDSSMNVEKIENGFLISESGTTGTGKNQKWYQKRYYSPTNPVNVSIPRGMKFGTKKSK